MRFICRVKSQGRCILKIRGLARGVVKSWPSFWGCSPLVGFTQQEAQYESYHEPKHTQITRCRKGRAHMPTFIREGGIFLKIAQFRSIHFKHENISVPIVAHLKEDDFVQSIWDK
jgi:hypothetical protein